MMATLMTGADLFHCHEPLDTAAFIMDGRAYSVFARDWQQRPHPAWAADQDAAKAVVQVPSRDQFFAWVALALRSYTRAEVLHQSPLREVFAGGEATSRLSVDALRRRLAAAVDELAARPRDVKFHNALGVSCLRADATQEAAAEQLGLPLNTFRYHVQRGISLASEILWRTLDTPS